MRTPHRIGQGTERITARQNVVGTVHRALATPGGTAGKTHDYDVVAIVMDDIGVAVIHILQQCPEVVDPRVVFLRRIHDNDGYLSLAQHVVVAFEQVCLDKDHLGVDRVDLVSVVLDTVAVIGITKGCLTLHCCKPVHQGGVVVVHNHDRVITAAQVQLVSHHIDDAVGQAVELPKGIAPVALDVYQGLAIPVGVRETLTDHTEIHLVCSSIYVLVTWCS